MDSGFYNSTRRLAWLINMPNGPALSHIKPRSLFQTVRYITSPDQSFKLGPRNDYRTDYHQRRHFLWPAYFP
jgi:hypothetical protein